MKKPLMVIMLVLVMVLAAAGPATAKKGKVNVKGEVVAVGAGTITVESNKGATYVFNVPEDFDLSAVHVGDAVLVKAVLAEGETWQATTIKLVGLDDDDDNEVEIEEDDDKDKDKDKEKDKDKDDDDDEGGKDNSAFCADGKQTEPHPLAPKIAERYGVSEEMVMGYFCEGYSMGAIMLAIKTSQIEGVSADIGALLASRSEGKGWGQIWKELGLIGNAKKGHSPPGLLKKAKDPGKKNK